MTMGAMDRRVLRSRQQLQDAVLEIVREGNARPGISEVCRRAGVGRPTFYQHFETVDDLLAAALDQRGSQGILSAGVQPPDLDDTATPALLLDVARRIDEDPTVYRAVLAASASFPRTRRAIEDMLCQRLLRSAGLSEPGDHPLDPATLDDARRAALRFASGGITSLLGDWIDAHDGARHASADEVGGHLWRLLRPLLTQLRDGPPPRA